MLFLEKKVEKGYEYTCNNLFGEVVINSLSKLDKDILDDIIGVVLKYQTQTGTIIINPKTGEKISYTYDKANPWEQDDETCENTHTSTKRPENVFTRISQSIKKISNLPKRFVEAFLEAWRKAK